MIRGQKNVAGLESGVFDGVHLSAGQFGHGEHVNAILLEDIAHRLIALDVAFVGWILKIVGLDVFPQALCDFWSR